jgi:hypothetical protein
MVPTVALWTLAGNNRPRSSRRPALTGLRTDWCETARRERLSGASSGRGKHTGLRNLMRPRSAIPGRATGHEVSVKPCLGPRLSSADFRQQLAFFLSYPFVRPQSWSPSFRLDPGALMAGRAQGYSRMAVTAGRSPRTAFPGPLLDWPGRQARSAFGGQPVRHQQGRRSEASLPGVKRISRRNPSPLAKAKSSWHPGRSPRFSAGSARVRALTIVGRRCQNSTASKERRHRLRRRRLDLAAHPLKVLN